MTKITLFWTGDLSLNNPSPSRNYNLPLGINYIAKCLETAGFEVTIIDSSLILEEKDFLDRNIVLQKCLNIVKNTNPDILGIGAWTYNMPFVAEFCKHFKQKTNIPIILGGYNATHLPSETLFRIPEIDYVIRGEGEYTMVELCTALNSNTTQDLKKIKGISFFPKNRKKVIHTPNRPQIKNLDELPIIDFELFKHLKKEDITQKFQFMISRGCIGNCTFCNTRKMWPQVRYFSIDYINKQIKHFVDLYSIQYLNLTDDTINSNALKLKEFSNMLKTKHEGIKWGSSTRIDMVSKSVFKELKSSGFESVFIGIESIIPESLKFLNKTSNPEFYINRIPKALKILKELDITKSCAFIHGSPNETKNDLWKLCDFIIDLLKKDSMEISCFGLTLFPGSPLWDMFMKGKINLQSVNPPREIRLFSSEYKKYPWMSPDYFCIKKNYMSIEEYSSIVHDIEKKINDLLNSLNPKRIAFLKS